MGTISTAQAQSVPGQWMHEHTDGILVTTEVRREIVQDPNFPSIGNISCLEMGMSTSLGLENGGVDVPSLDDLPLPDGVILADNHEMK